MTTPQLETLTELKLPDVLKQMIAEAYVPNDHPLLIAYVDAESKPNMSYRGSAIAFSDTQLAVWARSSEAGLPRGVAVNPNVMLIFREPGGEGGFSRAVVNFRGRAYVATDEAERKRVYDTMAQRERDADKEMSGVAVIIDLDHVTGRIPGYRLDMHR
jgi:Pyridoxamine 5'-phosphate oxidase